jgi:hypothetical protein
MGVSEIALLVSAAFWAFLWGPIGLVLSSPLTVCLVVLGRYSPHLEFLSVLLGDEPALDVSISFYQRLLARDQDEAEDLILAQVQESGSPEPIYDEMLLPALVAIKRNRMRDDITESDEQYTLQSIHEIVEDLGDQQVKPSDHDKEGEDLRPAAEPEPPIRVFGCPAHDAEDRLALDMLQNLLDPTRWNLELIAPGVLTAELLDQVSQRNPVAVCIAATPPGGLAHTRYLCKRLRSLFPELHIFVGRWGLRNPGSPPDLLQKPGVEPDETTPPKVAADAVTATLKAAGADFVAPTLLETRHQLCSLLPVLLGNQHESEPDVEESSPDEVECYVEAESASSSQGQGDGSRKAIPAL